MTDTRLPARLLILHPMHTGRACTVQSMKQQHYNVQHRHRHIVYTLNYGMAAGAASSSDVAQWSAALRKLSGDFAISSAYRMCFLLTTVVKRNNKGLD